MSIDVYDELRKRRDVQGIILNLPWMPDPRSVANTTDLLARLVALDTPTAILDNSGDFQFPLEAGRPSHVAVFRIAGRAAGRQVGQYLLNLGHRNVAYVSHVHANLWSHLRLAGIRDVFEEAGLRDSVRSCTVDNIETLFDRTFLLGSVTPDQALAVTRLRQSDNLLEDLSRYLAERSWSTGLEEKERESLRSELTAVLSLARTVPTNPVTRETLDMVLDRVAIARNEILYKDLYSRAIADQKTTALVAANDGLALNGIRHLSSQGIAVPDRLSVVGFDNSSQSLGEHLTTYDFDLAGIMHRMLWFIRQYDRKRAGAMKPPREVEGMVIERGTTRRVAEF
jgi:DNA-binding LacI/PurR family transcriptional regulator